MNEIEVINALTEKLSIPTNALLGYYSKSVVVEGWMWIIIGVCIALFLYCVGIVAKGTPDDTSTTKKDEIPNYAFGTGLQVAAGIILAIFLATNAPKLIVPEKYAVDEIMTAIGRATK
jgi:hypothetical protein